MIDERFESVKTLIFDYDGTLHETAHLYGIAFRKSYAWLVSMGYAKERNYSDEETSIYLGMNANDMWKSFMPDLPETIRKQASSVISREMDAQVKSGGAKLYDKVAETLDVLKSSGFKMVILSNCRQAYINEHRDFFGLDKWFDAYYAAESYGFIPKEKIFPEIQKNFEGDYLVIGDRDSDLETARVWNLASIGCLYGYGTENELDAATVKINDISMLLSYLI